MTRSKHKATAFLDLPPEIRTQIYNNVLELATISTGLGTTPRFRLSAKKILRLLLVNKLIYSETLPLFYRYQTVTLPIVEHPHSLWPAPTNRTFDLLVHLEIVFERTIDNLDTKDSDIEIARHLCLVEQTCKHLKTLLLELRPTTVTGTSKYIHPHWRRHLIERIRFPTHPPPSWVLNPLASAPPGIVPPGCVPTALVPPGLIPPPCFPRGLIPLASPPPGFALPGFAIPSSASSSPPAPDQLTTDIDKLTAANMRMADFWCDGHGVIDQEGRTVAALRSIWGRLNKLTIVLPAQGDYGLSAFTEYVMSHLLEPVEPERDWRLGSEDRNAWRNEITEKWIFRFSLEKGRRLKSEANSQ